MVLSPSSRSYWERASDLFQISTISPGGTPPVSSIVVQSAFDAGDLGQLPAESEAKLNSHFRPHTVEESGAFVETLGIGPTGSGPLNGLRFAVKDLIDIAGHRTGCGNPDWRDTHPPAVTNAVGVDLLLGAGAECIGKTVTDELAFGLLARMPFTKCRRKAPPFRAGDIRRPLYVDSRTAVG
jgi:hypothetical protein